MDKLILKMLGQDDPIYKYEIDEYWLDIGRMNDYEEANNAYEKMMGDSN